VIALLDFLPIDERLNCGLLNNLALFLAPSFGKGASAIPSCGNDWYKIVGTGVAGNIEAQILVLLTKLLNIMAEKNEATCRLIFFSSPTFPILTIASPC